MQPTVATWFVLFLVIIGPLIVGLIVFFRKYTGLSRRDGYLALVAGLMAGTVLVLHGGGDFNSGHHESANEAFLRDMTAGVAIVFLTAFSLRLWGRWVGEKATVEERQPGLPGVRAWFSTGNVIVGLTLVLTLWFGFDYSPLLTAVVIAGALVAYPLLRLEATAPVSAPVAEERSAEREKILAMLEAGKLTPEESAELLQALRETSSRAPHQVPLTGGQRLMLIGAALVAVGFFLPWLVVNPGKEAGRMMNQMQSSMRSTFQGDMSISGGMDFPGMQLTTANVSISGGDIPRGLGWATLLLALAAAALPYVATRLDAAATRTVRLLCLGLGSFILLYVLTQYVRFVSIGLILAIGGYAVGITGWLRDRPASLV
jgi:hypothetical protein